MYKKHIDFKTPSRDTVIWRYLTLPKFLSLLNCEQLYFSRYDKFFDAQEGVLTDLDKKFCDSITPRLSHKIGCVYINCWVISDVELYLMWLAYSSIDEGVAIKTTVGNLIDSLDSKDERDIFISNVDYIDYQNQYTFDKSKGFVVLLAPFFCKGKYFQQENELRLVHIDFDLSCEDSVFGKLFSVSLETLIDEIWISPKAEAWFANVIESEITLHNLHKPLKRSYIKTWTNNPPRQ